MELQQGALLQGGKYKIEKSLGQGGFGITYLAEQTNLGRKVCIKEFFMKEYGERTGAPHSNAEETVLIGKAPLPSGPSQDTSATVLTSVKAITTGAAEIMGRYQEKFVKEARTIARFDHPGIVRIHDVFEENGTAYYVMDYIEGENLNEMVKREGPLSEDRALSYIRQVADALAYIHGQNIMHLDVKPSNILVRKSDDKAILIDFGASKRYDSEGTQTSTTPIGLSAGYAPIELMKAGGVSTFSPETDIYSLGATLYYLVTGQNPPDASEHMEMLMEGEKFHFPATISSGTVEVIEQSMQARKKRIQNVSGFLGLLNSDGKKKRLEAEGKPQKNEAKRQEELRIEREKEEAEKKRIAEERAREDAEAKRQEALRKEREKAEAEKKRIAEKEAQNKNTMRWVLIALAAVVGAMILISIINNSSYSYSSYSGGGPDEMKAAELLGGSTDSDSSSISYNTVLPDPIEAQSVPSKNKEALGEITDGFSLKYISKLPESDEALLSDDISFLNDNTPFPYSYNGCNLSGIKRFNSYSIAYFKQFLMVAERDRVIAIVSLEQQKLLQDLIINYFLGVVGNLIIIGAPKDVSDYDTPLLFFAVDYTNGEVKWARKINHSPDHPGQIYENTLFVTQSWSDLNDDYTFTNHARILLIDVNTGKIRKSINIPSPPEIVYRASLGASRTSLFVECGVLTGSTHSHLKKFAIVH